MSLFKPHFTLLKSDGRCLCTWCVRQEDGRWGRAIADTVLMGYIFGLAPDCLSREVVVVSVDKTTFTVEHHVCHTGLWFWFILLAVLVNRIFWCPPCSFRSDLTWKAKSWRLAVFSRRSISSHVLFDGLVQSVHFGSIEILFFIVVSATGCLGHQHLCVLRRGLAGRLNKLCDIIYSICNVFIG